MNARTLRCELSPAACFTAATHAPSLALSSITPTLSGRIWQLFEAGLSREEMADTIVREYDIPADRASSDLDALLVSLVAEQLVVSVAGDGGRTAETSVPPVETLGAYRAPELQIYRDMQDLLALDPPMPGLLDIPWK